MILEYILIGTTLSVVGTVFYAVKHYYGSNVVISIFERVPEFMKLMSAFEDTMKHKDDFIKFQRDLINDLRADAELIAPPRTPLERGLLELKDRVGVLEHSVFGLNKSMQDVSMNIESIKALLVSDDDGDDTESIYFRSDDSP